MPRGFFTESAAVLFSEAPSVDAITTALEALDCDVLRRDTQAGWMSGGAELLVPFGEGHGGHVHVDVLETPWPDTMGDPESDPDLFGAWTMGAFGPGAFPGNLKRAVEQAVAFPDAETAAGGHGAFVRLRTSYIVGAGPDAPILPEGWNPLEEIGAMLEVAAAVAGLDGARAYFDPNAELILGTDVVREEIAAGGGTPLELFTHVRLFVVDADWGVMDTVGLDRFDLPDAEVLVPSGVDPNQVAGFLRALTAHLLENGPVVEDGHRTDGPFGTLEVHARDKSLVEPPRRVLRFVPPGATLPDGALD